MTKTTQYKNTPIGPIPTEWEVKKLGEVVEFLDGKRKPLKDTERSKMKGPYPYYGASGIIDYVNDFIFDDELILLGEDGANIINRSSPLAFMVEGKIWVNNHAHVLKPYSQFNRGYITEYLESISYDKFNTGTAQPKLNKDICSKIPIPLPPLPEQQKIAEILSTWDKAIQKADAIIKKLEDRNKALAFSLLTGKKRVKGFEGKWDNYKLEYFFEEYSSKPKQNTDLPVFTSSKNGLMSQSDYYSGGRISTRENVDYNIIPRNYITYRSRSDDGLFTFNKNTAGYDGLISGYYPVFKVVNGNDNFFLYYLNFFKTKLTKYSTGTSQLVLSFKALKSATFNLPSLEEQNVIAEILNTANQEVKQYQQKLEALKLQKKGLMQQLLTGKVRTV